MVATQQSNGTHVKSFQGKPSEGEPEHKEGLSVKTWIMLIGLLLTAAVTLTGMVLFASAKTTTVDVKNIVHDYSYPKEKGLVMETEINHIKARTQEILTKQQDILKSMGELSLQLTECKFILKKSNKKHKKNKKTDDDEE